jgi:hypothetical protein
MRSEEFDYQQSNITLLKVTVLPTASANPPTGSTQAGHPRAGQPEEGRKAHLAGLFNGHGAFVKGLNKS